jgi:hypothetical protein
MLRANYLLRFIIFCFLILLIFNPFVMARDIYLKPYTHTFSYYAPDVVNVAVIGTFNNWEEENGKMTRNTEGYWEKSLTMERGIQQYAYLVDGIIERDPANNDIECIDYKGEKVWISYLFIPFFDDLIFPDELENDLNQIKFRFYNSPSCYYEKQSDKAVVVHKLPELFVNLDVTRDFCNVIFEFTIFNDKNEAMISVSRKCMSWKGKYNWCYRCFKDWIENPQYILFKLKANGKEYSTKCYLFTYRFLGKVKNFIGQFIA